jgi:dTDP-4-dehydrorhamnose 3,5-epimerase-like enzyme
MIDLPTISEERGKLTYCEFDLIPFEINRIYYIYDPKDLVKRGKHSHIVLEQILIPLNGKVSLELKDGNSKMNITLEDSSKGLYIGPGIWREFQLHDRNTILLVLASHKYDVNDYVRE